MSTNRDETLQQFCDVTGADTERSRFYLESSNWQLEVALSSFYEHGGNTEDSPAVVPTSATIPVLSDSDMDSPPSSPVRTEKKDKKPKRTGGQRIATLSSLQQDESSSDEEEATCSKKESKEIHVEVSPSNEEQKDEIIELRKENERLKNENKSLKMEIQNIKWDNQKRDEGQAFYAGGSERSGQQIIGPGKSRKDIVTEMFKSVRERGAVSFEDEPSSTSRGGGGGAFGGTGYRLGQTPDDHETVPLAGAGAQPQANPSAGPRSVRLRLYREGYTVDQGELRHYTDPDNAEFLNCIRRGEIPPELSSGGAEVRVSLEDRRHEECPRPQHKTQAFAGKGHLLGSPTPPTVGVAATALAPDANDRAADERAAQESLHVDESQPTTTVQFRLSDGSRLTGRFNHSHTVGDLCAYLRAAAPRYQLTPFALLTAFPSAELLDSSATLAQQGLLNCVLLQRLK